MSIVTRDRVRAAVERALLLSPGSIDHAKRAVAQAMCLPVEAVHEALQPLGHCCPAGEALGVTVCDQCAEITAAYSAAMCKEAA